MKTLFAPAAFAVGMVALLTSAHAQGVPQGSYLRSCTGVALRGETLEAVCRARDGRERRTSLASVNRCVGDIGNNDGNLACTYGTGQVPPRANVAPPVSTPEPRYGAPRTGEPRYGEPRYGEPRYGEPRYGEPRYGEPRYGEPRYGERRERCEQLHREYEELRVRMEREFNPLDRARLEGRLRETREQEERCRR